MKLRVSRIQLKVCTALGRARRAPAQQAFPAALALVAIGLGLSMASDPSILEKLRLGPSPLHLVQITREDWFTGFYRAAVPQLPLTILNSVVAVCSLSEDLFPEKASS